MKAAIKGLGWSQRIVSGPQLEYPKSEASSHAIQVWYFDYNIELAPGRGGGNWYVLLVATAPEMGEKCKSVLVVFNRRIRMILGRLVVPQVLTKQHGLVNAVKAPDLVKFGIRANSSMVRNEPNDHPTRWWW